MLYLLCYKYSVYSAKCTATMLDCCLAASWTVYSYLLAKIHTQFCCTIKLIQCQLHQMHQYISIWVLNSMLYKSFKFLQIFLSFHFLCSWTFTSKVTYFCRCMWLIITLKIFRSMVHVLCFTIIIMNNYFFPFVTDFRVYLLMFILVDSPLR